MTSTSQFDFGSGPDPDPANQWDTKRKLSSLAEVCDLPSIGRVIHVFVCVFNSFEHLVLRTL